jgi:hypothetical protein
MGLRVLGERNGSSAVDVSVNNIGTGPDLEDVIDMY